MPSSPRPLRAHATIGRTTAAAGLLAAAVAWSAVIVAHFVPMCVPW